MMMRETISILLILALALGLPGVVNAAAAETAGTSVGVLSMMNITEDEYRIPYMDQGQDGCAAVPDRAGKLSEHQ